MRSFKITLAYNGGAYAGWQVQANAKTVQSELEKALKRITGQSVRAIASGRTDSGVHAIAQVVSLNLETPMAPEMLGRALNGNLPRDIAISSVEEAQLGFHAIRDALGKRYRYLIQDGSQRDVFAGGLAWQCSYTLDTTAMQRAADLLLGEHDFSSFEAAGSGRTTSIRDVKDIVVQRQFIEDFSRVVVEVEANGFLYNMVRNIVGTLVEVGRGVFEPEWIRGVLEAKDRKAAGPTAPPEGLYLLEVYY
ncbi:MAG: tRNA pseudouridine38-40 synthase [Pirellulaceae bacterium]|jgi:tRNA pseudouridine38-40 synthase